MNRAEAAQVLAVATAFDNRTVGDTNVMAWADTLADVKLTDAIEAVKQHYRETDTFIKPSHVREIVKRKRRDRLQDHEFPTPPAELDGDPIRTLDWVREVRSRIADGEVLDEPPGLLPRDVNRMLEGKFRSVDS